MRPFKKKRPHYEFLRKKWIGKEVNSSQSLMDKHFRHVALSGLGGVLLLTTPTLALPSPHLLAATTGVEHGITSGASQNALLAAELIDKLPKEVSALTPEQESTIADLIYKDLRIKVTASIGDKKLNRSYGLIGGEQHLYRYPGDTLEQHAQNSADWAMFGSSGIAPGLGAWGYFAHSKESFTKEDEERERYYLAVQTFLSPGFSERVGEYRDFYKYRKMLVVNPKTGQAVVAVIADAGPAEWTGKHLGGSPEVMHELGLATGPRKGAVLYFFLDDSNQDIPLGPVKLSI